MHCDDDIEEPIHISERSFNDFITDRDESGAFFVDPHHGSSHSHIAEQCLNLLVQYLPVRQFVCISLQGGLVSYAATLWPRHSLNVIQFSALGSYPHFEEALKRFTLHHILYWAEAAALSNSPFSDYIPVGIEVCKSHFLLQCYMIPFTRMSLLVHSWISSIDCRNLFATN